MIHHVISEYIERKNVNMRLVFVILTFLSLLKMRKKQHHNKRE